MDRLPNELLIVILRRLERTDARDGSHDLSNALLVSRHWLSAGKKALWRDVFLPTGQVLNKFSLASTSDSATLVESITLIITPEGLPPSDNKQLRLEEQGAQDPFACDSTKEGWEALRTLAEKLPDMTNLRSFSLTIRPEYGNERPWGFFIDSALICTILDKLPPSVEDLELVTGGMERSSIAGDASHLCSHLAMRLQHFKHVRLCLGMFCAQLLTQSTAPKTPAADVATLEEEAGKPGILRTLVLDTESMKHPTLCHRRSDSSPVTTTKLSDFASTTKGTIQRGQYPKIESLKIIGSVGGGADRSWVFVVWDVIRGRTFLHPWDRANHTTFFMRYKDLSDCDHEYFGSPAALRVKAEGRAWRETADRFRFSSEYALSTYAQTRGYVYKELEIYEGKEEYLKRSRLRPWFWLDEGKAGRWLLSPLVVEGFEVSHGPQYEKFVVQEDESGEDIDTIDTGTTTSLVPVVAAEYS